MLDNMQEKRSGIAAEAQTRIRNALAAKRDGVLESVARELGVSTLSVLEATPAPQRKLIAADRFDEVWREISDWGEIIFIVHTTDIILECKGTLPTGSHSHGFYNLNPSSPIHGHIKIDNCRAIYLVDRLFHGRRSCSVQFFNNSGESMFKIFLARDSEHELLPRQVAHFLELWNRIEPEAHGMDDDLAGPAELTATAPA